MTNSNPDFGIDVGSAGQACSTTTSSSTLPARELSSSTILADHTTFHLGGKAKKLIVATTEKQITEAVAQADEAGEPLMILSGGSNVLISDEGFDGTVVLVATRGVVADVSDCGGAFVTVQAGEQWDSFVAHAVEQGWMGIEALSGIPGLVGSTPIQNVGAYGQEVSQTIARVRTYDRKTRQFATFVNAECGFGYRDSIFKRSRLHGEASGRYVVIEVAFHFTLGQLSAPIAYSELARELGVDIGERVPAIVVRETVLGLRRGKGMVYDQADHDTWGAGSFFMNPILSADAAERLPQEAPRFAMPDGRVKTSAAWLINHAGFEKGYSKGQARLSTKHVLALTNRGEASAKEVLHLAHEIIDTVMEKYQIRLEPEPVLVGLGWA